MRRTRFMSLVFLVWSIAFLFVPEFRQGLGGIVSMRRLAGNMDYYFTTAGVSADTLQRLARSAEQQRDARTLAFVALHSPDEHDRIRLAEKAVGLDPQLTWVYSHLVFRIQDNAKQDEWIGRLELWDPKNAFHYLEHAELINKRRGKDFPAFNNLEALSKETAWRRVMEKAFAASRYEFYTRTRFDLERAIFLQNKLQTPEGLLVWAMTSPIPNLMNVFAYRNLLVNKLGKEAEQAGRLPEAMGNYWTAAHFGERMELEGSSAIEKLIGAGLQKAAYDQILPRLRAEGRADEALTMEFASKEILQRSKAWREPLAHSSNYFWDFLMLHLLAGLMVVFGFVTLLCVAYVNAKRWIRVEKKGRLFQVLTGGENYVPIFLFLACLGFHLSYYPYAANFMAYMNASGEIHNYEPLVLNLLPNVFVADRIYSGLEPGNPFAPYVWYMLGGLGLVVVLSLLSRRRAPAVEVTAAQPK